MKARRLILIIFVSLIITGCTGFVNKPIDTPDAPVIEDDPTLFTFGNKTYKIVLEKKNWEEAVEDAKSHGGYLTEISSESEQKAIFDMVRQLVDEDYTHVPDGGGVAYVWIGAVKRDTIWQRNGDNGELGREFWYNQGAIDKDLYVNWPEDRNGDPINPDNLDPFASSIGGQNYAAMSLSEWVIGPSKSDPSVIEMGEPGEWNDLAGYNELYYVIEGYLY